MPFITLIFQSSQRSNHKVIFDSDHAYSPKKISEISRESKQAVMRSLIVVIEFSKFMRLYALEDVLLRKFGWVGMFTAQSKRPVCTIQWNIESKWRYVSEMLCQSLINSLYSLG